MPIELVYGADPLLSAQAAAMGSGAAAAEEQRWRDAQLGEQQRQYDLDYDMRLQLAALQNQEQRSARGQQFALGAANLQSQNYNNQLEYDLGAQQLAQRDEQLGVSAALQSQEQQQLTNRTQLSQLGQIARQQQQQKFELAMAERKSGEEWMRTATPRQQQQFRQRWEQTHGMPWTAPEEALAAQEDEQQQARRQQWLGMLQAPDGSGELIVPENVADMLMGMEPEKAMNSYTKMLDTWQRRKKDEQAAQTTEMQWEETKANLQRDDALNSQKFQHQQQAHEQKLVMDAIKAVQQSKIARAKALEGAMTTDGKGAIPEELKLEDLLPANLLPNSGPPEWYLKLKPGEAYTAPDGSRRIKGG